MSQCHNIIIEAWIRALKSLVIKNEFCLRNLRKLKRREGVISGNWERLPVIHQTQRGWKETEFTCVGKETAMCITQLSMSPLLIRKDLVRSVSGTIWAQSVICGGTR
jgi:hypothetical protein